MEVQKSWFPVFAGSDGCGRGGGGGCWNHSPQASSRHTVDCTPIHDPTLLSFYPANQIDG